MMTFLFFCGNKSLYVPFIFCRALCSSFFRTSSGFSRYPPANLRARFKGFYSIYKIKRTEFYPSVLFGGDKGIRTPDLLTASQAL